jgi:DNA-binding response OmpR family regulator
MEDSAMPPIESPAGRSAVRALLVESHKALSQGLKRGLESQGFSVDLAADGDEARRKSQRSHYDLILLDLTLPQMDGLTLLQQWHNNDVQTRILVLAGKPTGNGDEDIKPAPGKSVLRVHDLEINSRQRTVCRGGAMVALTTREFDLLEILAKNRGKVVTRSTIYKRLYDCTDEAASNVVDVYIRYLRQKIDRGYQTALILTCWGKGYMLRGDDD